MDFDPTSIPFPVVAMAIGHYLALIMACLQGWTSESVAVWRELTGYLLVKAYHCKYTNSASEHECVIYEFVDEHKNKLLLRTDRHIGARRHTSSSSCSTSSAFDGGSSSPHPESDSKASSGSSDISSNKYLANDTIVRVQGHPDGCEVLKTITFNGDRSSRPSLWDVGILVLVVHNDGPLYTLHARQCYWFADTIFGALEMWENGTVVPDERGKVKRGRRRASIGSRGIVSVHRRKPEHIAKIWDSFKKLLQIMTQQVGIYYLASIDNADARNPEGGVRASANGGGGEDGEAYWTSGAAHVNFYEGGKRMGGEREAAQERRRGNTTTL